MGKRCRLAFLSQTETWERAENRIIDLIDEAYRRGKNITQPDIEKVLSSPPFNFSHGFVCKKLKQLEKEKKIRCWQERGVNHFDLPPLIPEPFKLAALVSALIIGVSTIIDVVAFGFTGEQQVFMLETGQNIVGTQGLNLYALKCGLLITLGILIVTILQYSLGMFKESKTKKHLNNN